MQNSQWNVLMELVTKIPFTTHLPHNDALQTGI